MARILAIDPGTTQSAYVDWNEDRIVHKGILPNSDIKHIVEIGCYEILAIEFIQSYGMPVGREVFETVFFCGRIFEIADQHKRKILRIARPRIKSYIVGTAISKDKDVRAALILRLGGAKKGEPLAGVTKDIWSALALAVYVSDGLKQGNIAEW